MRFYINMLVHLLFLLTCSTHNHDLWQSLDSSQGEHYGHVHLPKKVHHLATRGRQKQGKNWHFFNFDLEFSKSVYIYIDW